MPVGRHPDKEDRPLRSFKGKPQPLGVLTEWTCPSCLQKVEQAYELGCNHCGVGVPGTQPPPAVPSETTNTKEGLLTPRQGNDRPRQAEAVQAVPRTVAESRVAPLVVTRIIQYICQPGQESQMLMGLQRALVGKYGFDWGTITAAIVDDVSLRQQDILSLANRQPGVWLGGPKEEARTVRQHLDRYIAKVGTSPGREEAHPGLPFVGKSGMEGPPPNTGPRFTSVQADMARAIVNLCGLRVGYTLALALQNYAELAAQESMEPGKILEADQCLALANALMQEIPDEWNPEADQALDEALPPPPGGPHGR